MNFPIPNITQFDFSGLKIRTVIIVAAYLTSRRTGAGLT